MKNKLLLNICIYLTVSVTWYFRLAAGLWANAGEKCLSDMLCEFAHSGKYILYPFFGILIIGYLKSFIRSSIILRIAKIQSIVIFMIKKCIGFSLIMSVGQTMTALFVGMQYGEYHSNWQETGSYMFRMFGVVLTHEIPVEWMTVLFFYVTFVHFLIICNIIVLLWFFMEGPLTGFVAFLVILIYEGSRKSGNILFNTVDIDEGKIVYEEVGAWELLIYPAIIFMVFALIMWMVVRNKDFMRLS